MCVFAYESAATLPRPCNFHLPFARRAADLSLSARNLLLTWPEGPTGRMFHNICRASPTPARTRFLVCPSRVQTRPFLDTCRRYPGPTHPLVGPRFTWPLYQNFEHVTFHIGGNGRAPGHESLNHDRAIVRTYKSPKGCRLHADTQRRYSA